MGLPQIFCQLLFSSQHCELDSEAEQYEHIKLELERQWRNGAPNVTILFSHLHHAGGTAVCHLARRHTTCNYKSNCHHSSEFTLQGSPVSGSRETQLQFQKSTDWRFYSVEKRMPRELILGGPFIYVIVLRHPYLLTASNYLRQRQLFGYRGSLWHYIGRKYLDPADLTHYFNHYHSWSSFLAVDERSTAQSLLFPMATVNSKRVLQRGRARLEKFSVILLTDDMSLTAPLLGRKLGWDYSALLRTTRTSGKNQTIMRPKSHQEQQASVDRNSRGPQEELIDFLGRLSEKDRIMFRSHLNGDLQLFRYGRCLAQKQLEKEGLPPLDPYEDKFGELEKLLETT